MQIQPAVSFRLSVVVAALFLAPTLALAQTSTVAARITQAVDNTARVVIPNSKHPLAQPAYDAGRLDGSTPMQRMLLVLGISPEAEHQLSVLLDSQQTPGTANYHQWLTPDQFGQQFGPAPQDIQTITMWLQQQGFTIGSIARSGRWIEFSGTSAQVEAAFQTQMHNYRVNGESHVANSTNISIPAALAPVVKGVVSLHNFFSKPLHTTGGLVRRAANGTYSSVAPDYNYPGGGNNIAPADLATIYDIPNLLLSPAPATVLNGTGEIIAIVARTDITPQDVTDFQNDFGLGSSPAPNYIVNGPDPDIADLDDQLETTLDISWSRAAAPGATIDVVTSGSTLVSDGVDLSAVYIVDRNLGQIMSTSYGSGEVCDGEENGAASFHYALWEQAAAQSISSFVSTDDTGAAGCDPNEPVPPPGATGGVAVNNLASTWYDTAVGGLEFNESIAPGVNFWNASNGTNYESAAGYSPEKIWNDSCTDCEGPDDSLEAGGGGLSVLWSEPPYQTLNVTGLAAALGFSTSPAPHPRGLPDVALSASANHDGYLLCLSALGTTCEAESPVFLRVGGTSVASPAWAGIMALVDQKVGNAQGLANYVLYSLGANENYANCNSSSRTNPATGTNCVFNDITVGNNGVPGNDVTNDPASGDLGYLSGTGYDLASGLGSPNVNNLINAWNTAAAAFNGSVTTITSPANIGTVGSPVVHGTKEAISGTVARMSAAVNATPSGIVSLIAEGGNLPNTVGVGATTLTASGTVGTADASGNVTDLPGGSYNLIASYPGDGTFAGSQSAAIPVNISKEPPAVELLDGTLQSGSLNDTALAISYGTPVVFEALVSGESSKITQTLVGDGAASGTVTFTTSLPSNPTNISSAITLTDLAEYDDGTAEFYDCSGTQNCLPVGTNTINASYSGDNSFTSGNSSTLGLSLTITVSSAPTVASVSSPQQSTTVNTTAQVTLNALVSTTSSGAAPNGKVQFYSNGTALGSPVAVTGTPGSENLFLTSGVFASATASLVTTLPTTGANTITAQYLGDSPGTNYAESAVSISIVITTASLTTTTTAVVAAPSPATVGQSVTFTATVTPNTSPTLTGTVQFAVDGTNVGGAIPVSSGQAPYADTTLTPGSHTIKASYSGDSNYASSSGTTSETVNQVVTTTGVVASPTTITVGQSVTLTATVTPSTSTGNPAATGTVQFSENGNNIGSAVALASGQAILMTSALPPGTYTIKAAYSGDTNYAGSSGTTSGSETVNQVVTATALVTSNGTIHQGGNVTFTATVTPSTSTGVPAAGGTVQFTQNGTNIGSAVPLSSGQAQLVNPSLPQGNPLSIVATYGGDTNYAGSISNTVSEVVLAPLINTTTAVTAAPSPATVGQSVTFTATVTPNTSPTLTGTVQFAVDGTNVGGAIPVSSGQAQYVDTTLTPGVHTIKATYSGDTNYNPSNGSTSETVNQVTTTTAVVASPTTITVGQNVTLTATVTPSTSTGNPAATGTVQFSENGNNIGSAVALASGQAILMTSALPPGTYTIKAAYSGDTNYAGSSGTTAGSETVNQVTTTTTVVSSASTITVGQNVTFTATVSPSTSTGNPGATGSVQFSQGGTNIGSAVTLVGGQAQLVNPTLAPGPLTIKATYSGDTDYAGSSGTTAETVNQVTTTTTVGTSNATIEQGGNVTFTATVSPSTSGNAPAATGNVQFSQNGTNLGSAVTLSNGQAVLTNPTLTPGSATTIKAVYNGDTNYAGSNGTVAETVQTFTVSGTAVSVAQGATGQSTLTFTSVDGLSGMHTVKINSCTGISEVNCSFSMTGSTNSVSVTLPANGTVTAPLYIQTTAAGGTQTGGAAGRPGGFIWPSGSRVIALACVFCLGVFLLYTGQRERRWRSVVTLLAFAALLATAACSSSPGNVNPGTPIGNNQPLAVTLIIDTIPAQTVSNLTVTVTAPTQ